MRGVRALGERGRAVREWKERVRRIRNGEKVGKDLKSKEREE